MLAMIILKKMLVVFCAYDFGNDFGNFSIMIFGNEFGNFSIMIFGNEFGNDVW